MNRIGCEWDKVLEEVYERFGCDNKPERMKMYRKACKMVVISTTAPSSKFAGLYLDKNTNKLANVTPTTKNPTPNGKNLAFCPWTGNPVQAHFDQVVRSLGPDTYLEKKSGIWYSHTCERYDMNEVITVGSHQGKRSRFYPHHTHQLLSSKQLNKKELRDLGLKNYNSW
jgi:hypothetical protein